MGVATAALRASLHDDTHATSIQPGLLTYSYGSLTDNPVLQGPIESGQYTSAEFTQTLDDAGVLGSLGSLGDAYDNALAESLGDSFETELAIVEWVSWFNHDRLHSSIPDVPPAEFELDYAERVAAASPPGW